jgi:hypothetical protein
MISMSKKAKDMKKQLETRHRNEDIDEEIADDFSA